MAYRLPEMPEAVYESLDDMGVQIYRDIRMLNKRDAWRHFNSCPADRRGYLAYTIIGLHMTSTSTDPHVIDLDEFFRSVTK
jgi:hypothetical protein